MPNGSLEGAARLYQGGRAGRGSFLRLGTRTIEAGIGAAALHELEPAQKALAKTTTGEQRRDGHTDNKFGERKQSTTSTLSPETRPERPEALLVLPDPLIEIIALLILSGIAKIAGDALKNKLSERSRRPPRRRREGGRREPTPPVQQPEREQRELSPELLQFEQEEREKWMQRQEAHRRVIEQAQLEEQQRVQREADERKQLEEKKTRETDRGRVVCEWLEQEIQRLEIDARAENMKKYTWGNTLNVPVEIATVSNPSATEQDDETYLDRSQVGRKLSYSYQDIGEYNWTEEHWSESRDDEGHTGYSYSTHGTGSILENRREELTFGIGYFTDREHIIPQAQPYVSDPELQTGVEAYFIQRNNTVVDTEKTRATRIDEKSPTPTQLTETYVIPTEYRESFSIFKLALSD